MVVLEIKSQPSTEAVDGTAAVDVNSVDELAVRKVVIKVDAGVGVHQPVDPQRHAVQDAAIDLAVTQA